MLYAKNGEACVRKLLAASSLRPVYSRLTATSAVAETGVVVVPAGGGLGDGPRRSLLERFGTEGFACLPAGLDPGGVGAQRGSPYGQRGAKKRAQVTALVEVVSLAVAREQRRGERTAGTPTGRLVDLCGGCGHVGLVLAALFADWSVVIVDRNARSLEVAARRAEDAGLANVAVWEGELADFGDSFDICVALHACGAASDVAIAKGVAAHAWIICVPCCAGKIALRDFKPETRLYDCLSTILQDSDSAFCARSHAFRAMLDPSEYTSLARAADFGDSTPDAKVGSWRRAAKSFVEMDRCQWLAENGFTALLLKLRPLTATPKNDIIFAWPSQKFATAPEAEEGVDPETRRGYKVAPDDTVADVQLYENGGLTADFAAEDVARVRSVLATLGVEGGTSDHTFDHVSGSRQRKVIHAVAEEMGLLHRSQGSGAERRVRVSVRKPTALHPSARETG